MLSFTMNISNRIFIFIVGLLLNENLKYSKVLNFFYMNSLKKAYLLLGWDDKDVNLTRYC